MSKRYPAVSRRAKACPVRVEILEDRYLLAGFANSTLLLTPDSVTPIKDLAQPATRPVVDLVSQSTGAVLGPVSQSTGSVPDPVGQGTGAVLEPVSQSTGVVLEPVSQSTGSAPDPVVRSTGLVLGPVSQSTEPMLELVSQGTGAVLGPASRSTGAVPDPVSQGTGAVLGPASRSTEPVLEPVSRGTGAVLGPASQSTEPMLTPVSQGTKSGFELITTQVGLRSLPQDGAALGLHVALATRDGAERHDTVGSESRTQQENALAHFGADSQALLLGLPGLSGVADTARRQGSVFAGRETIWTKLETNIEARGETEPTWSGGDASGEDGVVPAAGRASAPGASADEPGGSTPGTEEQERLLPPKAPLSLNDLLGPVSGVIDEFFPFDQEAWKQATDQFFADVADLVEGGGNLVPWLTTLALLGAAYEIARWDLRRLQAQQVLDSTQLPDFSGLLPPGEP